MATVLNQEGTASEINGFLLWLLWPGTNRIAAILNPGTYSHGVLTHYIREIVIRITDIDIPYACGM